MGFKYFGDFEDSNDLTGPNFYSSGILKTFEISEPRQTGARSLPSMSKSRTRSRKRRRPSTINSRTVNRGGRQISHPSGGLDLRLARATSSM